MEHPAFHVACLEPSAQFSLIRGEVSDQPIMVQMVKTAPDIPFQDPFGARSLSQNLKASRHRILCRTCLAKAIRARVSQRFRDWVQGQKLQGLLGSVGLDGNAERTAFSVLLGDVNPFKRLWRVVLCVQLLGLLPLLCGCFQHDAVHTRGALAPIGAYPLDRQQLGGERVSEQALQTPHAVPAACPDRLHDTSLESADMAAYLGPIDGGPTCRRALRAFNDTSGIHRLRNRSG